jgi:hypothetical protein
MNKKTFIAKYANTENKSQFIKDLSSLLNVKAKELAEYKTIFSEIRINRLISTEYGLGIIDSQTGEVTITPYPKVKEL